jgi:GLPGLI family protein
MPGSKITILLCFFCLTARVCLSQKSITIHYRGISHLDVNDFKTMADSASRERAREEGKDSIDARAKALLGGFTEMFDSLDFSPMVEYAYVYREGNFVYHKKDDRPVMKFDLTNLSFVTLDSTGYPLTQKVIVRTFQYNESAYRYKQTLTNESKKIHGYDCTKLIVEEYDVEYNYTRVLTIWATRDIKPALSVRAVCVLHTKIFDEYTPITFIEKGLGGFTEIEAINLNR